MTPLQYSLDFDHHHILVYSRTLSNTLPIDAPFSISTMPAVEQIAGPRGPGYWASFDPNDYKSVVEALKEEFQIPESAYAIHYCHSGPDHVPPDTPNIGYGPHCLKDCLVFLLQGQILIEAQ
ncbi:hypothetical protein V8F33_008872 [Rhypophila sp. PSN 637]